MSQSWWAPPVRPASVRGPPCGGLESPRTLGAGGSYAGGAGYITWWPGLTELSGDHQDWYFSEGLHGSVPDAGSSILLLGLGAGLLGLARWKGRG